MQVHVTAMAPAVVLAAVYLCIAKRTRTHSRPFARKRASASTSRPALVQQSRDDPHRVPPQTARPTLGSLGCMHTHVVDA